MVNKPAASVRNKCTDTMHNKKYGSAGESEACKYLAEQGYEIIERNFNTHCGELDIIALDATDKNMLVFAEVKTRRNKKYGRAALSVTRGKLRHIALSSQVYIKMRPEYKDMNCRIDVIEVYTGTDCRNYKINHIKNVILEGVI